jgi:hypothetical protein
MTMPARPTDLPHHFECDCEWCHSPFVDTIAENRRASQDLQASHGFGGEVDGEGRAGRPNTINAAQLVARLMDACRLSLDRAAPSMNLTGRVVLVGDDGSLVVGRLTSADYRMEMGGYARMSFDMILEDAGKMATIEDVDLEQTRPTTPQPPRPPTPAPQKKRRQITDPND